MTGRYNRTSKKERFCDTCNKRIVGDEYHVLLECKNENITIIRQRYIPLYFRSNPNRYKFAQLFQDQRYNVLYKVALLVKSVSNLFR